MVLGIDDFLFLRWLALRLKDRAERTMYDQEAIKEAIREIGEKYEAGEISEEEYHKREKRLLEALQSAREYWARKGE